MSRSNGPVDSGSGTGGITITASSETTNYQSDTVSPPTLLTGSQVSVTASKQTYDRASDTINTTVTITNISDSAITGPFQIVLDSQSMCGTLANGTGSFGGWPYITVPEVESLDPSQSAAVALQFSLGPCVPIRFTPLTYAGSFD